ncbi:MAG: PAS domain-containing protein [Opitutaceae bacterium]|nr:PAS domain-containing protein [Opitutaceae bacterium]
MKLPQLFRRKAEPLATDTVKVITEVRSQAALLAAGALQSAIFNSANFSSIATDAKGVIQIFNVGAERMLGYMAADVLNKITPADISDPKEVIARAKALSVELAATITPSFEALVFKAEVPFLKATKPTTTPSKVRPACRRTMQRKDSHERRNEHTVQIPSHRAGQ